MFDVPPPFLSRVLDAYMVTWETFLAWPEKPVAFDFHDVEITTLLGKTWPSLRPQVGGRASTQNGKPEELQFRLTMGLRKTDGNGASRMSTIRCRRSSCNTRCSPQMTIVIGEVLFRDSFARLWY